jgi:hypothetical protein
VCLEPKVIGEICDRDFYRACVRIPHCEDLLPLVVDGGLEGVYLALDRFLNCENLMVLFDSEARNDSSKIYYTDGSIIRTYCADEVMLVLSVGT